ncbi:phytoene desaturase family protein [Lactobacillus terrae]|uniref:phytoene desaturase family protein n=1 Tax=Lactobacillus terrae TaxID=2269374 RepID=UPI000C1B6D7C|nr:phytoene desaturase family protein [Lactobacillus terrae]
MKKITIIGSGVGGLSAGIRLQKLGYDVDIYEKEATVGGKMNQIVDSGYKFDVGPTIVMMPDIYNEVFEFAGKNSEDYIHMRRIEPMMDLKFKNDGDLELTSDLVKLTRFMGDENASGYYKFLSDIYDKYIIANENFLNKSYRKPHDFFNMKSLVAGFKLHTLGDAYTAISKFVDDDRIAKSIAFQTLYIGISPYEGPSLYNIIPMIQSLYGVWYIDGGMYSMATAMAKLFEELGGKIHLNSDVSKIMVENKKATGIIIDDKEFTSDYVLANADFPYAMKNLIDETNRKKYTDKKIDSMKYSYSAFMIYLGTDKKYSNRNLHTIRFADDFKKNVDDLFDNNIFPEDPSSYIYIPSRIDVSMAPEDGESIYILTPVPELSSGKISWSSDEVAKYRDKILTMMEDEDILPDIKDHIRVEHIYTPKDFEQKFNAYNGAKFGLRPTLLQSNYFRPHNKSDEIDNLYFAGSSVHPGAGVPIVLNSAKLTVEEILRDDK